MSKQFIFTLTKKCKRNNQKDIEMYNTRFFLYILEDIMYLLAHSGVQHILSCVFLRPVYTMLPVSLELDCLFLIAPSIL